MGPVDLSILREIARLLQEERLVPERVTIGRREYEITYLEDHRQRLDDALRRGDRDRLGMLVGQLASKVKYQVARKVSERKAPARKTARTQAKKAPERPHSGGGRSRPAASPAKKRARAR